MHELDPDQWMDERSWEATTPAVPFALLPLHDHTAPERNRYETYAAFCPPGRQGRAPGA